MLASPKYLLVTAMKDEGPYILEWVAHHVALGIEHFLVVTNDCSDGTDEILERLQQLGFVTLAMNPKMVFREQSKWQLSALSFAQHYPVYKRAEWILHCDVDEFIQVKDKEGTLDALVEKLAPVDVISLTSVPFNSNGLNEFYDQPVTEQFLQCDRYLTGNRRSKRPDGRDKKPLSAIKPMFRNALKFRRRGNHRPYDRNFSETGSVWKDGSGRVMSAEMTDGRSKIVNTPETVKHVQLNHYAIRSVEASMLKFDRGDVMETQRLEQSEKYFKGYDDPGQDLPEYGTLAPKAAETLKYFHADPILGELHKAAFAHHKARFRELMKDGNSYALARSLGYFDNTRREKFLAESTAQRTKGKGPCPAQAALSFPENPPFEMSKIASLWVGPPMSFVEHVVMRSFLDAGHDFTLYSTDKLTDLPEGVTLADPRDIYQADFPTGPDLRHNNAVYADIFRLHMIRETGAVWADMDAYCLRPFIFPSGYAVGLEEAKKGIFTASNAVLGFPQDSQTLSKCIELVSMSCPVPPFFNKARRVRLEAQRDAGEVFGFQDFSWGVSGPRMIDYYMRRTDEFRYAMPKDVFFPGPRAFRKPLLRPDCPVEAIERPATVSVHIFGKTKAFLRNQYGGELPKGCYLERICKRHGVDPAAYPV